MEIARVTAANFQMKQDSWNQSQMQATPVHTCYMVVLPTITSTAFMIRAVNQGAGAA